MTEDNERIPEMGSFGRAGLPKSPRYVTPRSRRAMVVWGGTAALLLVIYFLMDTLFMNKAFTSPGPLSSNHAHLVTYCGACHTASGSVTDEKCSICHEKVGDDAGVYTYQAHYVYRSGDVARGDSLRALHIGQEPACFSCHPEHGGKYVSVTEVPDHNCVGCHEYGDFVSGHPEFEFVRSHTPDDSTLKFTHVRHSGFVMVDIKDKGGTPFVESTCLYCHKPTPDGKAFKPIDYDAHCGGCHLSAKTTTKKLRVRRSDDPGTPGVETLEMIQARLGPGTMWAFYTNPNEFKVIAKRFVSKKPLYHEDPWVLENLKAIRSMLYSDVGLADLVKTQGAVRGDDRYGEAVRTLRDYAGGIGSRPEPAVQTELARIDSLLTATAGKLRAVVPPASLFEPRQTNVELTAEQRGGYLGLVDDLTEKCQVCHYVADAGIRRVRSAQGVMYRAEFDHRAHLLQRRCLECHIDIPVADSLGVVGQLDPKMDSSALQNMPAISNCVECHNPKVATDRCVACHYMHPNKMERSNLKLFVDSF